MGGMQQMALLGSGTSWMPDSSPMWGRHRQSGPWGIMFHGNAFLDYDNQGGPRGATRVVSENWLMGMAHRDAGKGRLMVRGMFSLEPWDRPPPWLSAALSDRAKRFAAALLIDAQHPARPVHGARHPVQLPMGRSWAPTSTLRRWGSRPWDRPPSCTVSPPMEIPTGAADPPLAGLHYIRSASSPPEPEKQWKLEGSLFNGHEPDQNRTVTSDATSSTRPLSVRLLQSTSPNWSFQVSNGYLKNPEQLNPGQNVSRTTASAIYNQPRPDGNLALTFAWGRNSEAGDHSDGYTLEGNWNFGTRNYLFGRIDRVTERGLLDTGDPESEPQFTINAFTQDSTRPLSQPQVGERPRWDDHILRQAQQPRPDLWQQPGLVPPLPAPPAGKDVRGIRRGL